MDLDDEVCLCFHVTQRKLRNYIRIEQPRTAGQLADCFGAGTGCGWCRPFLQQLWESAQHAQAAPTLPDRTAYADARQHYLREGKGTPPNSPSANDADSPPDTA